MKSNQRHERVYLTRSHVVPDPQGGGPTIYPGGHQSDLPAELAAELVASGVAVPCVAGEPVYPEPVVELVEPAPAPEPSPIEEV